MILKSSKWRDNFQEKNRYSATSCCGGWRRVWPKPLTRHYHNFEVNDSFCDSWKLKINMMSWWIPLTWFMQQLDLNSTTNVQILNYNSPNNRNFGSCHAYVWWLNAPNCFSLESVDEITLSFQKDNPLNTVVYKSFRDVSRKAMPLRGWGKQLSWVKPWLPE